jgi:hypothetical protein
MTIRLDPKLYAYIKQQAPDNRSAFMEELVRKHSLDNVQDDVVARMKQAILNDDSFIDQVAAKTQQTSQRPEENQWHY